jgi:hypothetical protein
MKKEIQLLDAVHSVFVQLQESLERLTAVQYQQPCHSLFNNSIGQHVRHIIESFLCLASGYPSGLVSYETRKRDRDIEGDKDLAVSTLGQIFAGLDQPNKDLVLEASYDEQASETLTFSTNYYREIAHALEHTIHHMAMIRVGMQEVSAISVSEGFGFASSTIKHRQQCAQ